MLNNYQVNKIFTINLILIFFLFFMTFPIKVVLSAPGPTYKVINEEKKSCGLHFSGDEFSGIKSVPFGWKIIEVKSYISYKNPFGKCILEKEYFINGDYESYFSECCAQFGLEYVDYHQIPYTTDDVVKFNTSGWKCFSNSVYDYDALLINLSKKQCAANFDFRISRGNTGAYPTEGQCKITDEDWQLYENEEDEEKITTSVVSTVFGDCVLSDYVEDRASWDPDFQWQKCCEDLGLEYVGREIDEDSNSKQLKTDKFFLIMPVIAVLSILMAFFVKKKK